MVGPIANALHSNATGEPIFNSFLNRCVLRPSRHEIDGGDLIRCELPIPAASQHGSKSIETYVATNLNTDSIFDTKPAVSVDEDWGQVPAPKTLILKFPGTAGRAERSSALPANLIPFHAPQANVPLGQHYEVWTWNPPGYGRSEGKADLQTLTPAADAFASQLLAARVHQCDHTRVWLCGNSLGCLPALSLAARLEQWVPRDKSTDRFGVWLRNPPDLAEVVLRTADRYRSRFWMRHVAARLPRSLDAIQMAGRCELPAVFLMSEHDTLVPPSLQRQIHDAYTGEHHLVTLFDLCHAGVIEEQHLGAIDRAVDWLLTRT